jgi:hypothetical protein
MEAHRCPPHHLFCRVTLLAGAWLPDLMPRLSVLVAFVLLRPCRQFSIDPIMRLFLGFEASSCRQRPLQTDELARPAKPTVRLASGRCAAWEWNHSVIVKASLRTPQRASGADADSGRETWWATVNSTALDSRGRPYHRGGSWGPCLSERDVGRASR